MRAACRMRGACASDRFSALAQPVWPPEKAAAPPRPSGATSAAVVPSTGRRSRRLPLPRRRRRGRVAPMAPESIAGCLEQLRGGGSVLVVDSATEPPEAVLACAAARVTPATINFLVTHARGLVCVVLPPARMRQLGIPLIGPRAGATPAYGASIEARQGVSTGISAPDRATTILAAVAADATPADLVMPGHVTPIQAARGRGDAPAARRPDLPRHRVRQLGRPAPAHGARSGRRAGGRRGARAPALRVPDRRRLRLRALRLRRPAPPGARGDRGGGPRRPRLPPPGGPGHRARQQDPRLRPPGPGPRHGGGEPRARLPGGSARLRHRGTDPARPGRAARAPPHQQPAEDRWAREPRRAPGGARAARGGAAPGQHRVPPHQAGQARTPPLRAPAHQLSVPTRAAPPAGHPERRRAAHRRRARALQPERDRPPAGRRARRARAPRGGGRRHRRGDRPRRLRAPALRAAHGDDRPLRRARLPGRGGARRDPALRVRGGGGGARRRGRGAQAGPPHRLRRAHHRLDRAGARARGRRAGQQGLRGGGHRARDGAPPARGAEGLMGTRREARELALQALYQLDVAGEGDPAVALFWSHFDAEGDVQAFARELVDGVAAHRERIDALIAASAEHWRLPRLSRVDLSLLRLATFELLARADIPASVTIDEAIEIARRFGSEDSPAFVNGVLDHIAQVLAVKEKPTSPA